MRKLFFGTAALAALAIGAASCSDSESNKTVWERYTAWREVNNSWIEAKADSVDTSTGGPFFQRISPSYDPMGYVLVHWYNDRDSTAGNLQPMLTSTVSTRYKGRLYNDIAFDSSYTRTNALFTTSLQSVIAGWQIALQNMHVGDTCLVLVPYAQGYGANGSGIIPPYSALQFNMSLVDIPAWEVRP